MKQTLAISLILTALFFFIMPTHMQAFSQCRSERKGYCVKLGTENSPQTVKRTTSSWFFAGLVIVDEVRKPFPGLEFLAPYGIYLDSDIGTILSALYNFGVGIAGISAFIMFSFGGILYVTARDSTSQTGKARTYMTNALIGLLLIASSYIILYTINPDFTFTLKLPSLQESFTPTVISQPIPPQGGP